MGPGPRPAAGHFSVREFVTTLGTTSSLVTCMELLMKRTDILGIGGLPDRSCDWRHLKVHMCVCVCVFVFVFVHACVSVRVCAGG